MRIFKSVKGSLADTGFIEILVMIGVFALALAAPNRNSEKSLSLEYVIGEVAQLNTLKHAILNVSAQIEQSVGGIGGNFAEARSEREAALQSLKRDLHREKGSLPPGFFEAVRKLGLVIIDDP